MFCLVYGNKLLIKVREIGIMLFVFIFVNIWIYSIDVVEEVVIVKVVSNMKYIKEESIMVFFLKWFDNGFYISVIIL